LAGMDGQDTLYGGAGDDNIWAGNGNDVLYGEDGNDFLVGQDGNDYLVGGTGADTLYGGTDDDRLAGGLGNDTLYGEHGRDTFVFDTALNAVSNVDQIIDFNVAEDRIELSRAIFGKFGANVSLAIGDKANAAGPQIVYKSSTGELFYDVDGTGLRAQVKFAVIGANLALTQDHFIL
ncbi:calcium-binding protein, partial [Microvirga sp. 2MCAF38]|uniref:calcium-binding protein n=1 Tax=Microvirga sp. 2MCAF38 TaxID=3232989 RepID=UPI003F9A0F2C